MSDSEPTDLTAGVALADLDADGMVGGRVGDADVLLARVGDEIVAWDAKCTHVGAALPTGLRRGDRVHCPFHHACFSLRTGEAIFAPAFAPLKRWEVAVADGRVRVLDRAPQPVAPGKVTNSRGVRRVVVIGGGAAGYATVERLRRVGYDGELTLVTAEPQLPVDRTKLSKGYLGGQAGPDGLPLAPASWYADAGIDVRLSTEVTALDTVGRLVHLADGTTVAFDAAVLATGASPNRPDLPGFDRPDVHLLRTVADADAIIAAAEGVGPRGVVVLGAGFIGLETASAMRDRGVEVTVVMKDHVPLAGILGDELGRLVHSVHAEHGVRFVQGSAASWDGSALELAYASSVPGSLLVVGAGVRPRTELAEAAGLAVDDGILVDRFGETSVPGIFAAGDVARFPDPDGGAPIRVEHWAVAGRAGALAAVNLLGAGQPMDEPPFFWSKHFDLNIRYSGHAGSVGPDDAGAAGATAAVEGSLTDRDAVVRYSVDGRLAAVATVGRDRECLEIEDSMRPAAV
jgi:NADPH-dependent 2,4-dienoyl-CoA reductase/sulfur reductase-like enzyme/nitrite reductase/ring-hydroxylating ferredoxin subunit